MPTIGFKSPNRRIKAARILAFPLLSHDFQNMSSVDCTLIMKWYCRGSTVGFLLLQRFSVSLAVEYSSCFISVMNLDLYVCCFD